MSEPLTATEASQILDAIQALDQKLDLQMAQTEAQIKGLDQTMNGVKAEITLLRTDLFRGANLWLWILLSSFLVCVVGLLVKVMLFADPG